MVENLSLSLEEFIHVASWDKKTLRRFCADKTIQLGHRSAVDYLICFRRAVQVALAVYAKRNGYDGIQHNAVKVTRLIEKWCSEYFKSWAVGEILKRDASLATQKQALKSLANQAWEVYLRKRSY